MSRAIESLDTTALTKYLADAIAGFKGPLTAVKFADGQSNPTFKLTTPGGDYVLRRKPPGQLLKSAHAVDREYRVLQALRQSDVPVAEPYCLCDDDSVIGSMFYVMSFVDGRIFWDPALPELPRAERRSFCLQLVDVLARLHRIDIKEAGLESFGQPGNYFERQVSRWTRQYRAAETTQLDAMEQLMRWLPDNIPQDDGRVSLLHGDYRLDNVIFANDSARILAVLDWELSTTGDPLADLAYYCMCLRLPRQGRLRGLAGLDLDEQGIPGETEVVERYCEATGYDATKQWPFCLAFSFFRLASICQGVYKRSLAGNASSAEAEKMGAIVAPLANAGLAVLA